MSRRRTADTVHFARASAATRRARSAVALLCLATATVLALPGDADADTTGPPLVHVPVATAPYGRPIPLSLSAPCAIGASCAARLYYRTTAPAALAAVPGLVGEGGFQVIALARGAATTVDGHEVVEWSGAIPAAAVTTTGVDYFLEAEQNGAVTTFPGSTHADSTQPVGSYVHVHVVSPPLLNHVPVPFAVADRPITVDAQVSCSTGNCAATLHYRRTPATLDSTAGWSSLAMQAQGAGTALGDAAVLLAYRADVPASSVDTTGVDYYIHVTDGHAQAFSPGTPYQGWYAPRDGTRVPDANHHVHVLEPPRIAHASPPTASYRRDVPVTGHTNCPSDRQCAATLYYRTTVPGIVDSTGFVSTAMAVTRTAGAGGVDAIRVDGAVPASAVDTRGVDYFFSVTDGTTTAWWPGTSPADGPGVWVDGVRVVYQHVHVQEPPHLVHVPPVVAPASEDLVVEAELTCATEQCHATVYASSTPNAPGTYQAVAMTRAAVLATTATSRLERWQAVIPSSQVTTRGVAYYLTASDGYTNTAAPGTSYWGAYASVDGGPVVPETVRYVVRVVDPPHPVHVPVATAVEGEPIPVRARSNCAASCTATLHWRVAGGAWQAVVMTRAAPVPLAYGNDLVAYDAVVPGGGVTVAGVEYRIDVDDGYVTQTTPAYPVAVVDRRLVHHAAGDIGFTGTAHLPVFPCNRDPLEGNPCTGGSFTGDWTADLAGTAATAAFDAVWSTASGAAIRADYSYVEWECLHGVETVLGFAMGSGSAIAAPGEIQGKWHVVGETVGRDITGASMSFDFRWTRTLNSAVLVLERTTLTLDVAGVGPRVVVVGQQEGEAAFVVSPPDNGHLPTCDAPLTDVTGRIAGSVQLASSAVAS